MATKGGIHEGALKGFGVQNDAYARARPSYPDDSVRYFIDELKLDATSSIVDLGAGTGKMTSLLFHHPQLDGAKIIAVEPSSMKEKIVESLKPLDKDNRLEVVDGTSNNIPLKDESVDCVVIAQAFHWFDNEETLVELHRVLKKDKSIVLIWNLEDSKIPWIAKLREIYEKYDESVPQYRKGKWSEVFKTTKKFKLKGEFHTSHNIPDQTPQRLWERVLSKSYIASMSKSEQDVVKESVMKVLFENNDDLKKGVKSVEELNNSDATTQILYNTDVFIYTKIQE